MLVRFLLFAGLLAAASGQETQPASQSPEEPTLRITVTLVQVDAVVTDAKGKHVGDLKPEDFEVRQDGKVQKITHFSYIDTSAPRPKPPQASASKAVDKTAPALPSVPIKANQVRRTVAIVVDDLGLSFESMAQVRQAVKKFVDNDMQPGDLVAIIRTGAGMGALQQFTSDKRMLYAAIDRMKYNFHGRVGVSSFTPIDDSASEEETAALATENQFREEYFSVGTLGAINYVVAGLKELPGRKSVLVISENLPILQPSQGVNSRIYDALNQLTDSANRAAVVLNTIDPRGLPTLGFTAADKVSNSNPQRMQEISMARSQTYFESQNGMSYLADQTGGMFIHDTNDIARGIREVVEDQTGYYLIGYTPAQGTFDKDPKGQKFHRVKVNVLRAGLHVRSRTGFLGVPDSERQTGPKTREQQLAMALTSPFGAHGINVRLTSLFANNLKIGSYVQSMLYIDARDLKFVDAEGGKHKAVIDVVTMTFGDNGQAENRSDMTYTIGLPEETYQQVLKQGFVYTVNHPVKKAGAFQLRAVVRDTLSEKAGSASQFIEVPDVSKKRMALSGIVLKAAAPELLKAQNLNVAAPARPEGEGAGDNSEGSPSRRRFTAGEPVTYGYQVINAQLDPTTQKPQVETELRIYRDGQQIYAGKPVQLVPGDQPDMKRLISGGILRLGPKMTPGDYVLQIVATDKLGGVKTNKATQWIDFEVKPRPAAPPAAAPAKPVGE